MGQILTSNRLFRPKHGGSPLGGGVKIGGSDHCTERVKPVTGNTQGPHTRNDEGRGVLEYIQRKVYKGCVRGNDGVWVPCPR